VNRRVLGIVPARLGSTRLPRKPLHPLLGTPLLEWVWQRVERMRVLDHAVVATDSGEVAAVCRSIGAPVVITRADHLSGTDRVAEVASAASFSGFDCIVNIQGDEPLVEEEHVAAVARLVTDGPWELGTCATPLRDTMDVTDPARVKVMVDAEGRARAFSRSLPGVVPPAHDVLSHIGIYAYRRDALLRWATLPPSNGEVRERLEQLRALDAGMAIGVAIVKDAHRGVDTHADVARMEAELTLMGHSNLVRATT